MKLVTQKIPKFQQLRQALGGSIVIFPNFDVSRWIFHYITININPPDSNILINHGQNLWFGEYFAYAIKKTNNDNNVYVKQVDIIDIDNIRIRMNQAVANPETLNVLIMGEKNP